MKTDYLIIKDKLTPVAFQNAIPIEFDVPQDVIRDEWAVLVFVIYIPAGSKQISIQVNLNEDNALLTTPHEDGTAFQTIHEMFKGGLLPGHNTLRFTQDGAGSGEVKISDVLLWVKKL